jgi:hypothetical protein
VLVAVVCSSSGLHINSRVYQNQTLVDADMIVCAKFHKVVGTVMPRSLQDDLEKMVKEFKERQSPRRVIQIVQRTSLNLNLSDTSESFSKATNMARVVPTIGRHGGIL